MGPYKILQRICKVAYELKLPSELASVHPVFHVSMLKKCIGDPDSILPIKGLGVKKCRNKEVVSVKVLWKNLLVEGATWEYEVDMKSLYPHIF